LAFAAAERFFCVWLIRIIAIVFYASVAAAALISQGCGAPVTFYCTVSLLLNP
jgi:hypothetical protein